MIIFSRRSGFSSAGLAIIGALTILILATGGWVVYDRLLSERSASPTKELSQDFTAPEQPREPLTLLEDGSEVGMAKNLNDISLAYNLNLSKEQADYLEKNRFLLIPMKEPVYYTFDSMLDFFDKISGSYDPHYREPENTKLVTPDIVLHAYHKYFDLTLSELEMKELSPILEGFLTNIIENIKAEPSKANTDVAGRYQNILAQMIVGKVLIENRSPAKPEYFNSPEEEIAYSNRDKTIDGFANALKIFAKYSGALNPELRKKALDELSLIYEAEGVAISPLWGQYKDELKADYTQFTPRSHYTKNSALRAYFRAMMYLGRNSYLFGKDVGIKDANLLTALLPASAWQRITDITEFYAGPSDDITYIEWRDFVEKIIGKNQTPETLISDSAIAKIKNRIDELRKPRIFSDIVIDPNIESKTKEDLLNESLGFRVFSQKFTFDAWVLNSLTTGQEKADTKLPSTPSALFIPAVFGDEEAKKYSVEFLKMEGFSDTEVAGFMNKLSDKTEEIGRIRPDEWLSSLNSAWLNVLSTLTKKYGSNYPSYMQSSNFSSKQIQTFLGSYTELKHDTLLYAKQSYAELGAGGDEPPPLPPIVRGFVEPNLEFWSRLMTLIERNESFFNQHKVFQNHTALARLKEFKSIISLYQTIAKKEMNGQIVTESEYERLRTTNLAFIALPFGAEDPDEDSGKVALIADIHTDAVKGQILYEATGQPYIMLAYVNNENDPRLVVGLAFNHYELIEPLGRRLTDEDWKERVYDAPEKLPAKNFWYTNLLVK